MVDFVIVLGHVDRVPMILERLYLETGTVDFVISA